MVRCRTEVANLVRIVGTRQIKPMASVKNPGVSNKAPAINNTIPSNNGIAGTSPWARVVLILVNVSKPWILSKVTPSPAVNRIRAIVGKAPI